MSKTIDSTNIKVPEQIKDFKFIPLRNNEKIPKVKWGTNEELEFNGNETSYGIDTGRSNLVVIDCDTKGAENGINNFYAQCTLNGYEPNTFTVETPNEGLHFYYTTKNSNLKTSAGTVFGSAIDVRAWGGYVVGPGSIIKNDKNELVKYTLWNENTQIEELPKWMEDKILNSSKSSTSINNSKNLKSNKNNIINSEVKSSGAKSHEEEERNNALVWAIDKIKSASGGQRNQTLNSTAYFMGCKRVERIQAEKLMEIAIERGLDNSEAENTFNSGYESGLKEEIISYQVMVKEYNTKNGVTFKDDPKDSEFYSHVSLSYNFWKKYRDDLIYFDYHNSWYIYNADNGSWEKTTKKNSN